MIRVLIADDHPVVRRGLRQIVDEEEDMRVVAEAGDADSVRSTLEPAGSAPNVPDVLVLDLSMPGAQGIGLLSDVHTRRPELPILVLSIHPEEQYAVRCLKAGARGYVHKQSAAEELVGAIRTAHAGGRYLSPQLTESLLGQINNAQLREPHERLSRRELEVLLRIASGRTVSQIAEEMGLSVKTVSTYRTRMLEKLQLATNAEATRYALDRGLVDS